MKWPSIGPGHIVFENAGRLFLLDLDEKNIREIKIRIPFDAPGLRPEYKDLSDYIENFDISPDCPSALVEARGEIITVNSGSSYSRKHTYSSGIAERFPVWSPNGRNIAYFTDKTGGYNLFISPVDDPPVITGV